MCVWGVGGGERRRQQTAQEERRESPEARLQFQGLLVAPKEEGSPASTQPEHTAKSLGKLEKTFPFFPLTFFFSYDNSYFQMKGEKSQERNSQMSQMEKKKISEKNFRGEKLFYFKKSFEGCKVPRFSHLLHAFFFSDFFLVCLTFVR